MRRYIALLRGINVGRAKRIAMADLRHMLGELGFVDVRTLLNSGNVVFDAAGADPLALAAEIEEALVLKLGVASRVTVLALGALADIVAANSLLPLATDHARLLVFVLNDPRDAARAAPLAAQDWGGEALAIGPGAVYAWCPDGVLASRAAAALGKLLGDATTARNWATMAKLHALAAANPR